MCYNLSEPKEVYRTVISFVGTSYEEVKSQMESLGLEIGDEKYFHSDKYAEGIVIWQSIVEGIEVELGTEIDFHISLGPETTADPEPSEDIVIPSDGVDVPATVQTVEVDLSAYSEIVTVRIVVGGSQLYYGTVDCSTTTKLSQPATGTGTQPVSIYINGELVDSYELQF